MPTAYNEKTGEILVLGGDGQWSAPKTAKNPQTGEELYLDGNEWKPSPAKKPDPYAKMALEDIQKQYQQSQGSGGTPQDLAGIADAYVSREQSDRAKAGGITGVMNAADNFVRGAATGALGGGALDELNAAGSALLGGDYNEALDYQRARTRFSENKFGALETGTQIAGGVASAVAGARALGLGTGIAQTGRMLPTIPQALGSAGVGTGIGAADMYTRGEGGVQNRLLNAAVGGVLGGGLGLAAPYIGGAVSAGTQRVLDFLTSDQALRRLGISRNAANVLIRQLSTDDTVTATGAQRIRDAGPDAMLADAGDSAANLLDTAIQRSGPGSTAARQAVDNRAVQANQALTRELDNTFGPAVGIETRAAGVRQGTAQARGEAYDDAYDAAIDYSTPAGQEVAALWGRVRAPRRAAANVLLEEAGLPVIADGAQPTVRQIDYVTRALRTVAESGEGQGALGGINDIGRSAQRLAQQLRQATRTAVPEYGVALDTAADPIRRNQALQFGSTLMRDRTTREEVAEALANASAAERRAMVSGVRDDVDEILANVKAFASSGNIDARQLQESLKQFSSPAVRQKLTLLLGENRARAFFGQIGRFQQAARLRANTQTGSKTFARTDVSEQVKTQTEPGVIWSALEGSFPQAIKKIFQQLSGMTPERRLAMEDQLFGEIANALTTARGTRAEQMLLNLQRAIQARSTNQAGARALGGATTGATFGAGQSASQQAITE